MIQYKRGAIIQMYPESIPNHFDIVIFFLLQSKKEEVKF